MSRSLMRRFKNKTKSETMLSDSAGWRCDATGSGDDETRNFPLITSLPETTLTYSNFVKPQKVSNLLSPITPFYKDQVTNYE